MSKLPLPKNSDACQVPAFSGVGLAPPMCRGMGCENMPQVVSKEPSQAGYRIPEGPVKEEPVPTPHEAVWRGLPKRQALRSAQSRQDNCFPGWCLSPM